MERQTKLRREYNGLAVTPMSVELSNTVLSGSVQFKAQVKSAEQELGPIYNLSAPEGIDSNTGKTFSHEWEEGTN